MRTPVMAGNWKMYKTPDETRDFFEEFRPLVAETEGRDIVICPPFLNLGVAAASARGTGIHIGAQNLHWAKEGAFTGEISGPMIRAAGASHVIIGHSERRQYFGETDEGVLKKTVAALEAGLTPIVCVGERLEHREAGETENVLCDQCSQAILPLEPQHFAHIVIAYEPVWAIGTGRTATPEIAAEAHAVIRREVRARYGADAGARVRILYGGSVTPQNVQALMAEKDIDGVLVGGKSLDPASFGAIVNF